MKSTSFGSLLSKWHWIGSGFMSLKLKGSLTFLVAEVDGKVVGTVVSTYDVQFSHIHHLAVHPDYQNRGIGSLLLSEIERRLKARGCLGLLITVNKRNPRYEEILKFYRKRGFRVIGDYTHVGKIIGREEDVVKAYGVKEKC